MSAVRISLSKKNLKYIDKSGLLNLLLDFPRQCRAALEIAASAKLLFQKKDFKTIVFCGMGGSGIGAGIVRAYLYSRSRLPVLVLREFEVPAFVDDSTLVFISSYSGDTQETLSAYAQAIGRGAAVIAISSGGKLKQYAQRDGVSFIGIPGGLPPRFALGYLSLIPLCVLAKLGIIGDVRQEAEGMIQVLERLQKEKLHPAIGARDNQAKYVAGKLFGKFTMIYSFSPYFDVAAKRLKDQLNENAKAAAAFCAFPELAHNEIAGWQNPEKVLRKFAVIMLRDEESHPQALKMMDIVGRMLCEQDLKPVVLNSRGESLLSRIFSLIYTGDFISYYLAILYGTDPGPVERIVDLKKQL
ncbi:MAG: bifunctional phosphoglucose/phosphomannose isomerase [Candidatus Omnitrophota bacterium]|nr:bifunctional phosphoglucose/phosphomannose isomerase [Candidatus Omnitrophota bacterium]